jgi:hypothetical protein
VAFSGVLQQQQQHSNRDSLPGGGGADLGRSGIGGRRSSDETAWTSSPPGMHQLSTALQHAPPVEV